jgi:hypothetical protein
MRQTANSPERGKATNRKKSREKNAPSQRIQNKKSENKNTRNFALLPALVCNIEKHHSRGKRVTKLATLVRKSFAMHAHHNNTRETTNNAHNASGQRRESATLLRHPKTHRVERIF